MALDFIAFMQYIEHKFAFMQKMDKNIQICDYIILSTKKGGLTMLEITNANADTNFINMPVIKVIGVGGCGNNAINRLAHQTQFPIEYISINTDQMVLNRSCADTCLAIGKKLTKGFGAGGNPEVAYAAAEESADDIKALIADANMVILTAGMGGGTGTGALPFVAKLCKDADILTIAVVTTPFSFENPNRTNIARSGIQNLEKCVDTLLVISNDKLLLSGEKSITMSGAFKLADSVLGNTINTITNIIFNCGTVNLDFNDLKTILGNKGYGHLGIGQADENTSITDAVKQAINSPLLSTDIAGAEYVMVNTSGDVDLVELNNAIQYIQEIVGEDTKIMWGTVSSEEQMEDSKNSMITIIATGLKQDKSDEPSTPMYNSRDLNSTRKYEHTLKVKEPNFVIPPFLLNKNR